MARSVFGQEDEDKKPTRVSERAVQELDHECSEVLKRHTQVLFLGQILEISLVDDTGVVEEQIVLGAQQNDCFCAVLQEFDEDALLKALLGGCVFTS